MKKFLLILLTIIITITLQYCIPTYRGKSSFVESNKIITHNPISNVLIVGVGSMPSRVFLSNLSKELISSLAKNKIQSAYTYVGQIPRLSHLDINKLVTGNYDSYLILNPIDTSFVDLKKKVGFFVTPVGGRYYASGDIIGRQYKEQFYVELYSGNKDKTEKIWQGILKVDFDFVQPDRYRKIAKEIVDKIVAKK